MLTVQDGAMGIDALELARTHRPDLILMDIQLPEVSGLEVTKWLKEDEDASSPFRSMAVTAFAMKGDEERIREGGCEAYISKPISVGSSSSRLSGAFVGHGLNGEAFVCMSARVLVSHDC
jgi:two-component system cell cycle response regulator DivK